MDKRTVEDRLREEYFLLLPDMRRTLAELEAEVRYSLLTLSSHRGPLILFRVTKAKNH